MLAGICIVVNFNVHATHCGWHERTRNVKELCKELN